MINHSVRYYFLPFSEFCSEACDYCVGLGCLAKKDKSEDEIIKSLAKAKSGNYDGALFPCNFVFSGRMDRLLHLTADHGLTPIIQVNTRYIHKDWTDILKTLRSHHAVLNVLIDRVNDECLAVIKWLNEVYPSTQIYYTWVGRHGASLKEAVALLPTEVKAQLHLQYPHAQNSSDGFLATQEVYRELNRVKKSDPDFVIRPPKGTDLFDPRVDEHLDLEPLHDASFRTQTKTRELDVSVIIPSFNHRDNLICTLRHLFLQDLPRETFEIIVIDDGSTDGTEKAVQNLLTAWPQRVNFTYIHFPRQQNRRMGDSQFRAGVARNLGVKHSAGELLVFLDSDILVPNNYLRQLQREHETYDVIQTRRHYLTKDVSHLETRYADVDPQKHTFIPEGGYWHGFYESATKQTWPKLDYYWKYVCTYGLSLRKDLFKQVGWFRKNYVFYGFEDTDLGYRLARLGVRFHLSELVTYHLFHLNERSEYQNSDYLRHCLLRKTAKIFYRNNLQPEIFEHFKSMVSDGPSLRRLIRSALLSVSR